MQKFRRQAHSKSRHGLTRKQGENPEATASQEDTVKKAGDSRFKGGE